MGEIKFVDIKYQYQILQDRIDKAIQKVLNHGQYDYDYLQKKAQLVIDARGRFKGNYSNIISA